MSRAQLDCEGFTAGLCGGGWELWILFYMFAIDMENHAQNNDTDLIVALTNDYVNVYCARLEEDLIDVVKLNGFITPGIGENWNGLNYSGLLDSYTRSRVHPHDQDMFRRACSRENMMQELRTQNVLSGRYRIVENGEVHFYSYKYVKVSKDNEPLRAVAAFRNIDNNVARDHRRLAELEEMRSIIASSEMGIWHITLLNGQKPRMSIDAKARELIGIFQYSDLSEEEIYEKWYSGVDINYVAAVNEAISQMVSGKRSEVTYRWYHPTFGEMYVRSGGTGTAIPGGYVLSGYHYDVTEQVKKDHRSTLVINSLAHAYDFLNYIKLDDHTFTRYSEKEVGYDLFNQFPQFSNVNNALNAFCDSQVSEQYRDEIKHFADLSTINERMKNRQVLMTQFKNPEGIWFEWSYIVADRNQDGTLKHIIWALRQIDDEKQTELRKQIMLEDNIAANKTKTMFLQNMSHEIRTPLNAMFGFSQLLGLPDGSWTQQEKDQFNSYIFNSYNVLEMLIGDIIDIADSEHGNYRIEIDSVDVNAVCNNALMSVEMRVPTGVKLYFTSELEDGYLVKTDGRRIQQVLINYLTNACKHTHEGEIHLHCSKTEHPGKLAFSVTDTGSGVPADKADVIFNRFTKLNNFVQGSGLGLNICQMIADKLNGKVFLDKNYTKGARFVFIINDDKVG